MPQRLPFVSTPRLLVPIVFSRSSYLSQREPPRMCEVPRVARPMTLLVSFAVACGPIQEPRWKFENP